MLQDLLSEVKKIFNKGTTYQPERVSRDIASIRTLLPYRYYDRDHEIFLNENCAGFGFEFGLLGGADDSRIESFHELIKKLPNHVDIQVMLISHNQLDDQLRYQRDTQSQLGGIFKTLAETGYRYERQGAVDQFATRDNSFIAMRGMRCFWFVAQKMKSLKNRDSVIRELRELRESLEASLSEYHLKRVNDNNLLSLVYTLLCFDTQTLRTPTVYRQDRAAQGQVSYLEADMQYDPEVGELLGDIPVADNFNCIANSHSVDVSFERQGKLVEQRLVNLSVNKWPSQFALWQFPDCYNSQFSDKKINCPFVINLVFTVLSQDRSNQKLMTKKAASERTAKNFAKIKPALADEARDFASAADEVSRGELSLANLSYTVTLISTEDDYRRDTERAIAAYRANGFYLLPTQNLHFQGMLSNLPFWASAGGLDDLRLLKRTKLLMTNNVADLLPIIGDPSGQHSGVPLVTLRDRLYYFDPFNAGTDNYNIAVTGTSGSGKSFLVQRIIMNILAKGGWVFIIDIGDSYKKLCQLLGGIYLSGDEISLNPFTNITDINEQADLVAALLSVIGSPRDGLSDVQNSVLLKAIKLAFSATKTETTIDGVVAVLKKMHSSSGDERMNDIATVLERYTTRESDGDLFNKPASISPDARLVILELGKFEGNEDKLKGILMAVMMIINERMYLSDRSIPKACFIDEAWRLLSGDNKDAQKFIEKGYRTVRKHGGLFCTIAQNMMDFMGSSNARAVFDSSAIKICMRQNMDTFKQEFPDYFTDFELSQFRRFKAANKTGFSSMMLDQGGQRMVARFLADPFSRILFSTQANEFEAVERLLQQGIALEDAVLQVAMAQFPDEMVRLGYVLPSSSTSKSEVQSELGS